MQICLASLSVVEERMQGGIHLLHFYERKVPMDYIEQATSINEDEKTQAINIYIQCVQEVAHKNYVPEYEDPLVDVSSLFGEIWMIENGYGSSSLSASAYAKASVAFNFANLLLGTEGKFIVVARTYLHKNERVKGRKLRQMACAMDYLVTGTTPEIFRQRYPYMR